MTRFEYKEIKDVAEVTKLAGFEFTKYIKYIDDGEIIALRALNLRRGELELSDIKRIDKKVSDSLLRSKLYKNDIILTYTGNGYGDCAIIEEDDKYHLAPNICKIMPNTEKIDPYFLYSYIRTAEFYQTMSNHMTGSGQPTIPMKTIRVLKVPVPSMKEQKIIASFMKSINHTIRNNEIINKNLEQQAQELFKACFVTFEAFGGKMPSFWNVAKLGDIAAIKTNSFSPTKNPTVMLEHYSIPAFDEQKYPVFELASNVKSNKYILTNNSVMISKLNPDTKRVWRPICISAFAVSSTEFIIFEANDPTYKDFVFSVIDSAAFSNWMCAHTTGSTNSRQRTTPSATLEFQIALPDEKTITDFCAIVTPMYDAIAANVCENQRLAQLRDSILPKLMSGELDVSDIDL